MSQEIFEHNLHLLLARSWQPIPIERAYAERLESKLETHMRRCHGQPMRAGASFGASFGARFGARTWAGAAGLVAAALLLWLRPWTPAHVLPTRGPDEILAQGMIALRSPANHGDWRALASGEHHRIGPVEERILLPAAGELVLDQAPDVAQASLSAGAWASVRAAEVLELQLDRGQVQLHAGQLPVELNTQATRLRAYAAELTFRLDAPSVGPEHASVLVQSGEVRLDGGAYLAPAAVPYLLVDGRLSDAGNIAVNTPPRTLPQAPTGASDKESSTQPVLPNPNEAGLLVEVWDADNALLGAYRVWARLQVGLPLVSMPDMREVTGEITPWLWSDLQPGLYTVVVEAPNHVPYLTTEVVLGAGVVTPIKVQLERGRSLVGYTVDAVTGAPIQNALVSLVDLLPQQVLHVEGLELEYPPFGSARTDAAGRFEITNAPLVACDLRAAVIGYAPTRVGPIRMHTAGPSVPQEVPSLQIERGATLEGVIQDRDGNPVAGIDVVASRIALDGTAQRMNYGSDLTDSEGHYLIEALPAGSYVVLLPGEATGSGGPPIRYTQLVKQGHGRVDFPGHNAPGSSQGIRLRGLVLDSDSRPLSGVTVTLSPNPSGEWQTTNADSKGRVDLASVQPGRYEISIGMGAGYASLVFVKTLKVGLQPEQEFEVRMGSSSVQGSTKNSTGGYVVLQQEDGRRWKFLGLAQVDFRGEWRLMGLPSGRMRALAFGKDAAEGFGMTESFDTKSGLTDLPPFTLQPTGSLRITIQQANGDPFQGVIVRMRDDTGWELPIHNDPRTGPTGVRLLPIVPAGNWTLSIRTPDGRRTERELYVNVGEQAQQTIRVEAK
ncbi:MAG: hypothetical protein ACI9HE_002025 [Planctomycetota bacterium]|jgi:hypothetical protein